jgi:hypothetical protein
VRQNIASSSCVENDETLRTLLVHDPVAALSAADGVARPENESVKVSNAVATIFNVIVVFISPIF